MLTPQIKGIVSGVAATAGAQVALAQVAVVGGLTGDAILTWLSVLALGVGMIVGTLAYFDRKLDARFREHRAFDELAHEAILERIAHLREIVQTSRINSGRFPPATEDER